MLSECIQTLKDLDLSERQIHSLLIKLKLMQENHLVLNQNRLFSKVSIEELLVESNFIFTSLLKKTEKYAVSSIKIPLLIFQKIIQMLEKFTVRELFSTFKDEESKKNQGQYFTPVELVTRIIKELIPDNEVYSRKKTIIDFSAGLGDFLLPLVKNNQLVCYAVELDLLTFETLLFSIVFDNSLDKKIRIKAFLTFRTGDSILGFNDSFLENMKYHEEISLLYKQLSEKRKEVLFKNSEINIEQVEEIFDIEKTIKNRLKISYTFNWFLDFPEILLEEKGFDFVLGNPPWLSFEKIKLEKYSKIIQKFPFHSLLYGKFNFALLFLILAYALSKSKGTLVLPKGILSETYAKNTRQKLVNDQSISKITILERKNFPMINNEFCLLTWDKDSKKSSFSLKDEEESNFYEILISEIKFPLYRLPTIPLEFQLELKSKLEQSFLLDSFCKIRRGLTLTRKYQKYILSTKDSQNKKILTKKLVRNNKWRQAKEGIFNFQVFYDNNSLIYNKELLGAPGSEDLFEKPKIIRRNRGSKWIIGLDVEGEFYINDIFDIILPREEETSLFLLFGYLASSFFQFLSESFLQRDITSNLIRYLPFINLEGKEDEIESEVKRWLFSYKKKEDAIIFRKNIDKIIFDKLKLSTEFQKYILSRTKLFWR